jgi:hypothetical protein
MERKELTIFEKYFTSEKEVFSQNPQKSTETIESRREAVLVGVGKSAG